jgi:hypothetical protein
VRRHLPSRRPRLLTIRRGDGAVNAERLTRPPTTGPPARRDRTPLGGQSSGPQGTANDRTAELDLDSVYLDGPTNDPQLYDAANPAKLKIDSTSGHHDLPRATNGTAIIGDERNGENLLITQVHLAVLRFHNRTVDVLQSQGTSNTDALFAEAQRLTRWHYQWVVVNDFLRRVIGQTMLDTLLEPLPQGRWKIGVKHYKPRNRQRPMMPVEYAAAAFRFGHSMLRARYQINANTGARLFDADPNLTNLNGGSLADRNLLRGKQVGLASGQKIATQLGVPPLTNQQLGIEHDPGWNDQAPLWFYLLKESELAAQGNHLGPVGGRIVGEDILGLLEAHQSSYLHQSSQKGTPFKPASPFTDTPGQFTMAGFLKFAQVV